MAHKFYDPQLLHSLLHYEAETGIFIFKPRQQILFGGSEAQRKKTHAKWTGRFCGKQAFTAVNTSGYLHAKIFGKCYLAHRCAWVMHYGTQPNFIDHINGDKIDNRINNLRNVTKSINSRNRVIPSNNTSGFPGVSFAKSKRKWHAYANENGVSIHLGFFETKEEAVARRMMHNAEHGYIVRPIDGLP